MENMNNKITVVGLLETDLTLNHIVHGEQFYTGMVQVKRLSGTIDHLPVTIPGKLLGFIPTGKDRLVRLIGQVRSYNKLEGEVGHLCVTIFVQRIEAVDGAEGDDTINKVEITGALCRPPVYRVTPFGREISDMMVVVNRAYGKSDYVPCITWGRDAQWVSIMRVGTRLSISGRLQAREYQKLLDDGGYETRTAIELSAFDVQRAADPEYGMAKEA